MRANLTTLAFLCVAVGCSGGPSCIVGESRPCACSTGAMGAQVCQADGTLGECVCVGVDGGPPAGMDAGPPPADAGPPPADSGPGPVDSGTPAVDSGTPDAGPPDAGPPDAGPPDAGSTGYVLSLPTDDSRVLVSDVGGDLYPSVFTYELWVNFDRLIPGLDQWLMYAGSASPSGTIALWVRGGTDSLECMIRHTGIGFARASLPDASTQVTAGAWHHIACTLDGAGDVALFLDGVRRATGTVTGAPELPAPGTTLGIGHVASPLPPLGRFFRGLIDEVRISNTPIYAGPPFTPARHFAVETSTAALFRFDEGTGTTTTDAVGPGRHAAVLDMGATWAPE